MALTKKVVLASAFIPVLGLCGWLLYYLFTKDDDTEEEKTQNSGSIVIEVPVPNGSVGSVIGRGGSNIKEVQEKTNTRIAFMDPVPDSDHRVCRIRGLPENAQLAEAFILSSVHNQPFIETCEINVPQKACGRIIGKLGETIRSISKQSNAAVNISRADHEGDFRRVIIKGTAEQIEVAKLLIEEKISEDSQARQKMQQVLSNRAPRNVKRPTTKPVNNLKRSLTVSVQTEVEASLFPADLPSTIVKQSSSVSPVKVVVSLGDVPLKGKKKVPPPTSPLDLIDPPDESDDSGANSLVYDPLSDQTVTPENGSRNGRLFKRRRSVPMNQVHETAASQTVSELEHEPLELDAERQDEIKLVPDPPQTEPHDVLKAEPERQAVPETEARNETFGTDPLKTVPENQAVSETGPIRESLKIEDLHESTESDSTHEPPKTELEIREYETEADPEVLKTERDIDTLKTAESQDILETEHSLASLGSDLVLELLKTPESQAVSETEPDPLRTEPVDDLHKTETLLGPIKTEPLSDSLGTEPLHKTEPLPDSLGTEPLHEVLKTEYAHEPLKIETVSDAHKEALSGPIKTEPVHEALSTKSVPDPFRTSPDATVPDPIPVLLKSDLVEASAMTKPETNTKPVPDPHPTHSVYAPLETDTTPEPKAICPLTPSPKKESFPQLVNPDSDYDLDDSDSSLSEEELERVMKTSLVSSTPLGKSPTTREEPEEGLTLLDGSNETFDLSFVTGSEGGASLNNNWVTVTEENKKIPCPPLDDEDAPQDC